MYERGLELIRLPARLCDRHVCLGGPAERGKDLESRPAGNEGRVGSHGQHTHTHSHTQSHTNTHAHTHTFTHSLLGLTTAGRTTLCRGLTRTGRQCRRSIPLRAAAPQGLGTVLDQLLFEVYASRPTVRAHELQLRKRLDKVTERERQRESQSGVCTDVWVCVHVCVLGVCLGCTCGFSMFVLVWCVRRVRFVVCS